MSALWSTNRRLLIRNSGRHTKGVWDGDRIRSGSALQGKGKKKGKQKG